VCSSDLYPVEVRYRPLVPDAEEDDDAASSSGPGASRSAPPGKPGAHGRSGRSAPGDRSGTGSTDDELDQPTGICLAADELMAAGPGDILVFCSGEREIRDATEALAGHLRERCGSPGAAMAPAPRP